MTTPASPLDDATRLWNANYLRAMASNFLLFFSFYLLTPLLPIYMVARFDADKDLIGMVLSGYVLAALLVRPFSGYVVDTFDRKRVLMACFFFFFVLFGGYLAAGTVLLFAVVRTLHGLPFGAVTVANSTVAMDVLPSSRRNEGIGYYGLSNNLAMAFAPSVGIYVYSATGDFELLFWLALALAGLGFYAVTTIRVRPRRPVAGKPRMSLDRFFLTRAWLMAVNIALFGMCWGVMSSYVAIYGKEELGVEGGTGVFFMLLSLGLFASRLQGAKALRQGRLTANCAEGVLLSLAGYTLFAAVEQPWAFYLSAVLIGLGNGHMYPAMLTMFVGVARHDQRGTANSSILTAWDAGLGLGILAGGVIVEHAGYAPTFWFAALLQAAGTLLFFLATRSFFLARRLHEAEPS